MAETAKTKKEWQFDSTTPILLLAVTIPLSMFLWAGNRTFQIIRHSDDEHIPPTRWLASILIPIAFLVWGLKRGSVNLSGAMMGFCVGFVMTLANYCFLACLVIFFVTSSKATKFRAREKRKIEVDFKEGGQRNWIQVLCNSGMAPQLALLYIFEIGVGQRPIDFIEDFRASWFALGVMSAYACSNADTWASELGTVLSSSDPRLITSLKKVPRGVNGGVSVVGIIVSVLGGMAVGASFYLMIILTVNSTILEQAPPQWPVVVLGAAAGLFGSVIDSFFGATLQYSGVHKKTGVILEQPGPEVKYICGRRILDNHSVNLLSNIITAIVMPRVANLFWPYY
uniref:Transmembrane protein 19 n=1 Tax=Lygus hesperus TaxID=30085 RepID=A0A0A9YTF6_LYGHE